MVNALRCRPGRLPGTYRVLPEVTVTSGRARAPSLAVQLVKRFCWRPMVAAVAASVLMAGCALSGGPAGPNLKSTSAKLDGLRVVPRRVTVPAYDRSCRKSHACVFGPAWSDDVDVAGGHDGCSTRDDVLKSQLRQVQVRAGTHGCVVTEGDLVDAYTGDQVHFTKSAADRVEIDHVFPLAASWDFGASGWTLRQRRNFANDPRNLLATSEAVNRAKSDKTPSGWSPPTGGGTCTYARVYVGVAYAYGLAVTTADRRALRAMLKECS
jgi:hypothetical protein